MRLKGPGSATVCGRCGEEKVGGGGTRRGRQEKGVGEVEGMANFPCLCSSPRHSQCNVYRQRWAAVGLFVYFVVAP